LISLVDPPIALARLQGQSPVGGVPPGAEMDRVPRLLRLGWLALSAALAFASPARADLADKVLSTLEQSGGVDPDTIEMARYAINSPSNAAVVFQHAASLDYPFFAIVGAIKAVKNQNLPGIGVFTEGACLSPIGAIDPIFGSASSYIDDAAGQATTTGVVNQAKQYAAAYEQQPTAAGKQQAASELSQYVPYFNELPVICDFAFNTNFKTERNLQSVISETVKAIRDAYNAFASGDIGEGVDRLVAAGFNSSTVCKLADEIVSGGLISSTPILGDIIDGACKSFAGAIIKGVGAVGKAVYNAGKEFVEDAVCAFEDIFTDCEEATPPPPTGIGNATAFCAPFGGLQAAISKTNAPDDYSVVCNDGSACIAKPGQPVKCQSAARSALSKWASNFLGVWAGQCEDDQCRGAMPAIRDAGFVDGIKVIAAQPTIGWPAVRAQALIGHEQQAADEVAASLARYADTNKSLTASASEGWVTIFVAVWDKKCWDGQCIDEVKALGDEFGAALNAAQAANPDESSLKIQGVVGQEYGPKFQLIIDASNKRKLIADPYATAEQKLPALGCNYFLGRERQWLCPAEENGFAYCVDYVNNSGALLCFGTDGLSYGEDETVTALLQNQHCNRVGEGQPLGLTCLTETGKEICQRFVSGGMAINCDATALVLVPVPRKPLVVLPRKPLVALPGSRPLPPPALRPLPLPTPLTGLAAMGCQKLGPAPQDWLCPGAPGFAACVASVRRNAGIALCMERDNQARYATNDRLITFLAGLGCQSGSSGPLAFTCGTPEAIATCQTFATGGMRVSCTQKLQLVPRAVAPLRLMPAKPRG
jgi:hypothetical protein